MRVLVDGARPAGTNAHDTEQRSPLTAQGSCVPSSLGCSDGTPAKEGRRPDQKAEDAASSSMDA